MKQADRVRIACRNGGGALRGEVVYPGLGEIPEYHLTGFTQQQTHNAITRSKCATLNEDVAQIYDTLAELRRRLKSFANVTNLKQAPRLAKHHQIPG